MKPTVAEKLWRAFLLLVAITIVANVAKADVPTFSCKSHGRLIICDATVAEGYQIEWKVTAYREQTYITRGKQVKFLVSKKLTTIELRVLGTTLKPMTCYVKRVKGKVMFGHHEENFK